MTCEVCGIGIREARLVRYELSIGERMVVVEHVPADVCPRCGETTFQPDVVERLQETIKRGGPAVRRIEVPVYEFAN